MWDCPLDATASALALVLELASALALVSVLAGLARRGVRPWRGRQGTGRGYVTWRKGEASPAAIA